MSGRSTAVRRILCCCAAVLFRVFIGAVILASGSVEATATTTAESAPHAYDAPTISRVGVEALGTDAAASALLGGEGDQSSSLSVVGSGTSTTPTHLLNATEAVPGGSNRAIVIGEDMEGRVIPKARELGADYYDPPIAPRNQWMENNLQWINDRMDEGCTIYNCGPAPGRANYPNPTSPYYQMELDEIAKRNYPIIEVR